MPKAKASIAERASPALQPHRAASPLATRFLSGCRFAHTKNSSGRVCTCITSQCSVQTEQGFERPSAQGELQSGRGRLRAGRARGDPADSSLPAGVSGSTCVGAAEEPVASARVTFRVRLRQSDLPSGSAAVLARPAVFSSLFFLFHLNCAHDDHARCIALKPKVSCLISS